jgi:hypothetical protein
LKKRPLMRAFFFGAFCATPMQSGLALDLQMAAIFRTAKSMTYLYR